ncbi:MAG: hypothetical protein Fur0032_09160 [Terrimicrobiaceae bacterium]
MKILLFPALGLSLVFPVLAADPAASPSPAAREVKHQMMTGKDFQDADLGQTNFMRVRLNKADFSGTTLTLVTFRQSDLSGSNFTGANFGPETKFIESTLNDAVLEGLDLKGADFSKVNLRGANLKKTSNWGDVSDCTFSDANLCGADLSGAKGDMETVQWSGAIYDDATKFPAGVDPVKEGARKSAN